MEIGDKITFPNENKEKIEGIITKIMKEGDKITISYKKDINSNTEYYLILDKLYP